MTYIVAADVGGTCTDAVIFSAGHPVFIGKALSTPPNFGEGVIASVASAAAAMGTSIANVFANTSLFVHGSTIVDNTILTRSGAKTGLLITEGFEDTLAITRGAYGRWAGLTEDGIKRPVATERPSPMVPRERVRGIPERVDYKGAALRVPEDREIEGAVRFLIDRHGVEAIAVCLLWSFYNPSHEERIREIVRRVAPEAYVTLSAEVAPVPGEYERASTTVINAYAGRITKDYLDSIQKLLASQGFRGPLMVMQGYGGLLPANEAGDRSVGMVESGPAAGVIASRFLGDLMGDSYVIAADMGGTTFKVGVVLDSQLEYAREPLVDRYHFIAPKMEIVSIGAGGGSIISIEERTRSPKVGPRSAGARPGPVCYGQGGTEPTLTDVMTLIGYMDPNTFLGGSMKLDVERARRSFEKVIAKPLGMPVVDAAIGVYRIAAAQITDLIREITVERGLDPRDFVLHAFGGTCPMLCGMFGSELQVRRIVVPYTASVNCAFGLVSADIKHEFSVTKVLSAPCKADEINAIFEPMMKRARRQLAEEGFSGASTRFDWSIDLRYSRQVHEVTTPVRPGGLLDEPAVATLVDDFEALYERKYGKGSAYREAGIEMTMFRLSARGLLSRPTLEKSSLRGTDAGGALIGTRPVFVEACGGLADGKIYDFGRLEPGNLVTGPAVIQTPITTIVLQDRQTGRMDVYRNFIIERG